MAVLAKPSALARKVSKWERVTVREREKRARERQAERKWRALSAMVCFRDKSQCRVCQVLTLRAGDPRLIGAAHHIVYRSAGGTDTMSNLVWTCGQCHDDEHQHRLSITGTAEKLKIKREVRHG
jgi:5-methylcytosine-specific restriction endonuclease McrA